MSTSMHDHLFVPAGRGDSRSPCPALNALANHSHIPHSGRSIPFMQLVHALRAVYKLSYPLAFVLSIVGFVWCGHLTGSGIFSIRLTLDLHDLARHGRIEHDGSLGHADTAPNEIYAPTVPDHTRVASLLDAGSANGKSRGGAGALSLFDLVRVRYRLDAALGRPLDAVHDFITRGEVALTLLAMGVKDDSDGIGSEGLVVPRHHIAQWFGEDRLPEGWTGPGALIGLRSTGKVAKRVKVEVARLARYS